jgi:hypothetical protein
MTSVADAGIGRYSIEGLSIKCQEWIVVDIDKLAAFGMKYSVII